MWHSSKKLGVCSKGHCRITNHPQTGQLQTTAITPFHSRICYLGRDSAAWLVCSSLHPRRPPRTSSTCVPGKLVPAVDWRPGGDASREGGQVPREPGGPSITFQTCSITCPQSGADPADRGTNDPNFLWKSVSESHFKRSTRQGEVTGIWENASCQGSVNRYSWDVPCLAACQRKLH